MQEAKSGAIKSGAIVVLYVVGCMYALLGLLTALYVHFTVSVKDCMASSSGLIHTYCEAPYSLGHTLILLAWPWFWW
ncbi:hypothetical protein ACSSV8_002954 [Roseovarius sp. MBR-79]